MPASAAGGFMKRLTRAMAVMVTAAPLVLAATLATGSGGPGGAAPLATGSAARAATAYPPGGPDQTPVMGWSSWSFLRLGANETQVEGEAKALVSTGLAAAGYQYVNLDDGWYQ